MLVSVVMAAFNEERYIGRTIESVLSQTLTDFEFIIVNDGSKDRTQEVARQYQDSRIAVLANNTNIGVAKSTNRAIRESKGQYIAIIDAGDMMHPTRLQEQVDWLSCSCSRRSCILGSWANYIDELGVVIGKWEVPLCTPRERLFLPQIAIHPTLMIRKSLFDSIGLYDERYNISLEFEFFLRAYKQGWSIRNLPKCLTDIMVRDGVTSKHLKATQWNQFRIKMQYLPYFLSPWNAYSTSRSLAGLILPTSVLRGIVDGQQHRNVVIEEAK